MSVDDRVVEALRRIAPGLIQQSGESKAKRRGELRDRLAEIDATDLQRIRVAEAQVQKLEAQVEDLMAKQNALEAEGRKARGELSDVRGTYSEHRDATWNELDAIPCETLTEFRGEVEGRIANLSAWERTWPGKVNQQIGRRVQTGNANSLDTYAQALLDTKGNITDAIRKGLDGEAAIAAVAAMRASWPQVQVGHDEYATPTWHG